MVGPFVFFDQMGPVTLPAGKGLDVRPHPHIGLATLTYLLAGEIEHKDSLGTVQRIRPGEVNWMTAGRGIVHSERTPPENRRAPAFNFGLQIWIGLPREDEEMAPAFSHHSAADLPVFQNATLVAGTLGGQRSPVPVRSPMFFADVRLDVGTRFALSDEHPERAVYVIEGVVDVDGQQVTAGKLAVLAAKGTVELKAFATARAVVLGGEPIGPRRLWWNFVSSDMARIRRAADDWKAGRFAGVPGDNESIPLPEQGPPAVDSP